MIKSLFKTVVTVKNNKYGKEHCLAREQIVTPMAKPDTSLKYVYAPNFTNDNSEDPALEEENLETAIKADQCVLLQNMNNLTSNLNHSASTQFEYLGFIGETNS